MFAVVMKMRHLDCLAKKVLSPPPAAGRCQSQSASSAELPGSGSHLSQVTHTPKLAAVGAEQGVEGDWAGAILTPPVGLAKSAGSTSRRVLPHPDFCFLPQRFYPGHPHKHDACVKCVPMLVRFSSF